MLAKRLWVSLVLVSCGGGGPKPGEFDPRDVSGNYALTYDDRLTLKLDVGGAVREVTQQGYGGVVDFGTINGNRVTLNLSEFCAKPEVQCPSEAFWSKVAVTQPNLSANRFALQELTVVDDTVHVLDAGQRAKSLGGLVDANNDDRFLLGLGVQGGASQNCAALAVSLAGGRFTRFGERFETTTEGRTNRSNQPCPLDGGFDGGAVVDAGFLPDGGAADGGSPQVCEPRMITRRIVPPDAGVEGIAEGKVFLGWAGGCAFGPVLLGATLTLETGYTGRRTGPYDPPPFTPAPVVLPDGGVDGGSDGGP
ncbi:MAG: hypothetical protein JNJ54_05855 [Myxococcaceae bacterium]|nr:hypothetical protein [Myxococcaceae bacterium]